MAFSRCMRAFLENQLVILDFRLKLLLFLPSEFIDNFFRNCNDILEVIFIVVGVSESLLQFDNTLFAFDHSIELWHHTLDKGCGAISIICLFILIASTVTVIAFSFFEFM